MRLGLFEENHPHFFLNYYIIEKQARSADFTGLVTLLGGSGVSYLKFELAEKSVKSRVLLIHEKKLRQIF
jgi:hypothetical protein